MSKVKVRTVKTKLPSYFQIDEVVRFEFAHLLDAIIKKIHFDYNSVTYDVVAEYYSDMDGIQVKDSVIFYNIPGRHLIKKK